jgi:hypothetical protein
MTIDTIEDGDRALEQGRNHLAYQIYMRLSEIGEDPAIYKLCTMCHHKRLEPQEVSVFIGWLQKKVESGYGPALFNLAYLYEKGDGIPKDRDKAIHYYSLACERELPEAYCNLAHLLLLPKKNSPGAHSFEAAFQMLEKAALMGYLPAIYSMGSHFYKGDRCHKDMHKAYKYFFLGAKLGHDECKKAVHVIDARRIADFRAERLWAHDQLIEIETSDTHRRTR